MKEDIWCRGISDGGHCNKGKDQLDCFRKNFLPRPWWARIWIIQEFVLARNAIIICGRWCASWDYISTATASFGRCLTYIDEIREATLLEGMSSNFNGVLHQSEPSQHPEAVEVPPIETPYSTSYGRSRKPSRLYLK